MIFSKFVAIDRNIGVVTDSVSTKRGEFHCVTFPKHMHNFYLNSAWIAWALCKPIRPVMFMREYVNRMLLFLETRQRWLAITDAKTINKGTLLNIGNLYIAEVKHVEEVLGETMFLIYSGKVFVHGQLPEWVSGKAYGFGDRVVPATRVQVSEYLDKQYVMLKEMLIDGRRLFYE